MMSEDPPRDPNSTPPGAPMDPDAAKAAIKANQTACAQGQANYLAQFYDAGKDPPPYSGMTPGNSGSGAQGGPNPEDD